MNVFVLSRNVRFCARQHCDQHVVKMPLESAQLLSTALHETDFELWQRLHVDGLAYKPTHRNHPCAIWTRECINNYLWLAALGLELCREHQYRFDGASCQPASDADKLPAPRHKCYAVLCALARTRPTLPRRRSITPFALVVPDDCLQADPVLAYRCLYVEHKSCFASWTRRPPPDWYVEALARRGETARFRP